jgi:hypothetical protein
MKQIVDQLSPDKPKTTEDLIIQSLAKLDVIAMGVSVGLLFGMIVFLATNILILKGGADVGRNLSLLGQFFIGYEVTFVGSLSGFFWGFASGYILGSLVALLRNFIVSAYLFLLKLKSSFTAVNDYIDNP